jgi:hypothetical protein
VGQLINVIGGLLTTLIGYIIGRVWQKLVDRIPYRRARIFWGPLLDAKIQIVVSRFVSAAFPEPTGLVGGGDALALREISSYFSKIGLRHKVVYVDEAALDRNDNLILLGGPDVNAVTKDALRLISPQLRLSDPGPGIPMEVQDLAPDSSRQHGDPSRANAEKIYKPSSDSDYGIIIRARNPFNPDRGLIIFAGAYGYGVLGGVNLAFTDRFLQRCERLEAERTNLSQQGLWRFMRMPSRGTSGFLAMHRHQVSLQLECIFRVGVFDGRPHAPEVIVLRPLSPKTS